MTSIKQKLDDDNHITCQSIQTNKKSIRFLLDSGSDLNLIKLSALKGDVMVYYYLPTKEDHRALY